MTGQPAQAPPAPGPWDATIRAALAAFATDPAYAEAMAHAARKLRLIGEIRREQWRRQHAARLAARGG